MTQPIGQTVLGGLTFSTTMTLFLMPILYYIFNHHREKRNAKRAARHQKRAERKAIKLAEESEARMASKKRKSVAEDFAEKDNESGEEFSASSFGMEDLDE